MHRITATLGAAAALSIGFAAPAAAVPGGLGPKPDKPAPHVVCVTDDSVPGFRTQTCTNLNTRSVETITEVNPD